VWNLVCQREEITLKLLRKINYRYSMPEIIIRIIYLFPKFFVLYCNTMKAKHWIVGRKVTKSVTDIIIYIYIYIYIHTYTYVRLISQ
jgi:hypothetical protein